MSDLSMPPRTLAPLSLADPDVAAARAAAAQKLFAWPAPEAPGYAPAMPLAEAEPAELEGPNGTVTQCRLLGVQVDAGTVRLQTATSRSTLTLKFSQFRRLTLMRPLKPLAPAGAGHALPRALMQLCRITFSDQQQTDVKSLGHVSLPLGHFTFSPLNGQGDLLRSFYPRARVLRLEAQELPRSSRRSAAAAASTPAPASAPAPLLPPAQAAAKAIHAAKGDGPGTRRTRRIDPTFPDLADPPDSLPAGPKLSPRASQFGAQPGGQQRHSDREPHLDLDFGPSLSPGSGPEAGPPTQPPLSLLDEPRAMAPEAPNRLARTALDSLPPLPELTTTYEPELRLVDQRPAPAASSAAASTPARSGLSLAPLPGAAAPPTLELTLALPTLPSPTAAPPATRSAGLGSLPPAPQAAPQAEAAAPRSASDILQAEQISTPEQLLAGIEAQAKMPMVRIGEALMALGFITEQKLGDALQQQSRDRSLPLGELLVRRGDVTRANLQTALARKMGYPIVDVAAFQVEPEAAGKVAVGLARKLVALPLMLHGGRLIVALEDPSARQVIDEIEFSAQCKVVPVLARAGMLAGAIEMVYMRIGKETIEPTDELRLSFNSNDPEDSTDKLLANLEQETRELQDDGPVIEQSDNSLVRLINTMILEARQQGVSDIHIECPPSPQKVRVRFRRDGMLKPYIELPPGYRQAIVARLKIMCDLDISERRKPQDGKIALSRFMQGQKLELRVATIPTANGLEDVVMRLLSSARALPLTGMDLHPEVLARFQQVVQRPYGLVLCVGPTGSGKTTTLHAALGHINTPERKIWTAEDPVEITQPGLRQVQVNPKIDWTFAKALRAFLRADPDVVMVGEIRDEETAQMAIEASLTGHLVMSTLHTNSAPETVTRLLDMGMDPFSFADSLLAVLAQRLVRRWCKHCVTSQPADEDWVQTLAQEYLLAYPEEAQRPAAEQLVARWRRQLGQQGVLMQYQAPGCPHCHHTGFSGRLGLHELLMVSRDMRHLVQTRAPALALQTLAMTEGMRTLRQDGIVKTLAGLTAIEEVRAISNG